MISFKDWLYQETGTGTGDIAGFARIALPLVTRTWSPDVVFDMDVPQDFSKKKKKKTKKQPQVED